MTTSRSSAFGGGKVVQFKTEAERGAAFTRLRERAKVSAWGAGPAGG